MYQGLNFIITESVGYHFDVTDVGFRCSVVRVSPIFTFLIGNDVIEVRFIYPFQSLLEIIPQTLNNKCLLRLPGIYQTSLFTLLISGSEISSFLSRLNASISVSPNSSIGSFLSLNRRMTSFLGSTTTVTPSSSRTAN